MSEQNVCPKCELKLSWDAGLYRCDPCGQKYNKVAFCPDCVAELERLQACGAASYFCKPCNELKSKSQVRVEFQPLD